MILFEDSLHFLHIMRGQEDGDFLFLLDLLEVFPDFVGDIRVEAGAVRADDAHNLAGIDLEGDVIDDLESFKKLGDGFDFDDRMIHPPLDNGIRPGWQAAR